MPPKKIYKPRQEMIKDFKGSESEIAAFKEATQDDNYIFASTFIEQIGVLCHFLRNETIRVKYRQIGDIFSASRQKIRKYHMKYLRGEGIDGRPTKLTAEETEILKAEIIRCHSNSYYPTIYDVERFITNKFKKHLYIDTIRHFIRIKFNDLFKNVPGTPLEDKRFQSSIIQIENNINQLKSSIQGIPIDFIFNLDEMGCSEYEDRQERTVIVPIQYKYSTAPYPVSRTEKHATCLACINLNGLFCPPQYVVQRSTIDSELYNFLDPESIQIVNSESGYVNSQSLTNWFYNCFLAKLHKLREEKHYTGPALLIMDGYLAHYKSILNINLTQENLKIHYLVPHTSEQTQPLDLGIFAIAKRFMSNYKNNNELSRQTNQILKIHTALCQSTTMFHCRSAFKAIGIETIVRYDGNILKVFANLNLCKITKIREYQIEHIDLLIKNFMPLTPNQIYIYQNYQNKNRSSSRIPIMQFNSNYKYQQLPMPLIFTKK